MNLKKRFHAQCEITANRVQEGSDSKGRQGNEGMLLDNENGKDVSCSMQIEGELEWASG